MNKITKVLKAIFFSGKFSTEWRKNNLHNFTTPVTKFKMDAVKVGKGTYGKLFVVTRDYQNVKLSIGNYCSIAGGVKFLLSGNHQYDIISTYPYELLILNSHEAGIAVAKGEVGGWRSHCRSQWVMMYGLVRMPLFVRALQLVKVRLWQQVQL